MFTDPVSCSNCLTQKIVGSGAWIFAFPFRVPIVKVGRDLLNINEHGDPNFTTNSVT